MTRTFTDSEGNKFEVSKIEGSELVGGTYQGIIKPIKVEKNATYLEFVWGRKKLLEDYSGQYTLPTAQKVAAAIEALMEYVTDPDDVKAETAPFTWVKFERLVMEARAALQKEDV